MRILITGSSGYIGSHLIKYVEQAYKGDEIHFSDVKNNWPYQDFENEDFDVVFHLGATRSSTLARKESCTTIPVPDGVRTCRFTGHSISNSRTTITQRNSRGLGE